MINTITKIKEYNEGAKKYYCLKCKHFFTVPKKEAQKDVFIVKCYYCGNAKKEENFYVIN